MKLATRLRIMSPVFDTPQVTRGSAGTGRRAGFRIQCSDAWGFESPLPHYLAPLCDESLKRPLLKNQPGQAWPAGFWLRPTRPEGYNRDSGNGEETVLYAARPLPQHQLTARHKRRNETFLYAAPLPVPKYAAEVVS